MRSKFLLASLVFGVSATLLIICLPVFSKPTDPMVVHEWGTFTSLQDETGASLGRINTDDEPVPGFVHEMANTSLYPPTVAFTTDNKGTFAGDENVTMRLETPVLYFHPPKNQSGPISLDVNVEFRGGWLTQYYPNAMAGIEGVSNAGDLSNLPALKNSTVGTLSWNGSEINSSSGHQPVTDDHVWTAPRAVNAASIARGGEREQFLFYRGVGHIDAPLKVVRNNETLEIHCAADGLTVRKLWLVDIRADGNVAFRLVSKVTPEEMATTPAEFSAEAYSRENMAALRTSMHDALVAHGLFADEADALLNTWDRSYFQNPGERLFFMVPQSWTDAVLPLNISVPSEVTRVMVGRIELITPGQREIMHEMAQLPVSATKDIKLVIGAMSRLASDPARKAAYSALVGGHGNLNDLGISVPAAYADFLALGRFRTAMILNSKTDSEALERLATCFGQMVN